MSSAKTVLLPAWSMDAGAWAIVEMETLSPGCLSCVIHHWHKYKKAALVRLSDEVQMHCNIAKVQWKVYEINISITHTLIFGVLLQTWVGALKAPVGGAHDDCTTIFGTAGDTMRGHLENVLVAARMVFQTFLRWQIWILL